ncbi:class I SAM-dependent methyltransferase [Nocardioides daphniae]|uniref:Methyltransferase domain-containing protein n=1 Tax=Nocardioides daphniae TaxID=402297 RepID=A0ABQ1QKB5_9ACTN|nr:class I SAM-dependent methyltransferase [Nocardioides daphniae]GGD31110.1 hypothetical protein GCM10007231_33320 [Nocardioides daphniae]
MTLRPDVIPASTSPETAAAPVADDASAASPVSMDFGPLTISYDGRVLTPRPWTQIQSSWAVELLAELPEGPVLEICTGAGHIGLLALALTDRDGVLVDADPVAASYAVKNADAAGLADRVEVRTALAQDAVAPGETFPLAIVDPPWVKSQEVTRFPEDPLLAIDGGDDGLAVARQCLHAVDACLHPDGAVLLQLGTFNQVAALEEWLEQSGPPHLRVRGLRSFEDRGVVVLLRRPEPGTRLLS